MNKTIKFPFSLVWLYLWNTKGEWGIMDSPCLSVWPTVTRVTNRPTDVPSIYPSIHQSIHFSIWILPDRLTGQLTFRPSILRCFFNSWRTHEKNSLKFSMLIYADHLQNWLDRSNGLLIFLNFGAILTWWNGSVWGFQLLSRYWRKHRRNRMKFSMLMYSEIVCPFSKCLVKSLKISWHLED